MRHLIKIGLVSLALTACAASEPEPIMTDEKFESRTLADGSIEFVFGLSWRNTSQDSLRSNNQRDYERSDSRDGSRMERADRDQKAKRFAVLADNQTKLELEDKAAESLQKRLKKEKLCADGYQIDDVFWRDADIRLLGSCL
ncbi:hypothetical protein [Flavobacterium sp. W21_SRS_FM6]|uniref:hypothetical protein n=1 Tax=Flavobacterium sp. W21_SRS_FM6 TaxID=3240268 RepID=UPI003F8F7DD1